MLRFAFAARAPDEPMTDTLTVRVADCTGGRWCSIIPAMLSTSIIEETSMQQFALADLFPLLDVTGPDLLLRDYGRRAFPVLERALCEIPEGRALRVENAGVRVMDTSFCDETIVELLSGLVSGKYGDRYLMLLSPTPATIDNLEGTIARRKLKLAILVRQDDVLRPVGHLEPNLLDTWLRVQAQGSLTTRELTDTLGLEINTASMRLYKLFVARLLCRQEEVTEEGRQYLYLIPS